MKITKSHRAVEVNQSHLATRSHPEIVLTVHDLDHDESKGIRLTPAEFEGMVAAARSYLARGI